MNAIAEPLEASPFLPGDDHSDVIFETKTDIFYIKQQNTHLYPVFENKNGQTNFFKSFNALKLLKRKALNC